MANDTWFWDAYTDWAYKNMGGSCTLFSPVFIRLKKNATELDVINTFAEVKGDHDFRMELHEQAYSGFNQFSEELDNSTPRSWEFYIYVRTCELRQKSVRRALETYFNILDVGAPVELSKSNDRAGEKINKGNSPVPVVAIIDDGIGFLNTAFRQGEATRFAACWVQAREKIAKESQLVFLGKVLERGQIQDILKGAGFDEAKEYAKLNDELVEDGAHRSTDYAFSHGTHVLDLAAGSEPQDADYSTVSEWPLLAVQMPPSSVEDSSGMRFETHMVMGVRWILAQMEAQYPFSPVVINISFGLMAGPKNGTRFSEYQIAKELEKFPEAHVVYAYGNGGRSQMVANIKGGGQVSWLIPPDNFSSSFVEIMALGKVDLHGELALTITQPNGTQDTISIPPNTYRDIDNAARLYHVGSRVVDPDKGVYRPAHLALVVGPTGARAANTELALAGEWGLELNDPEAPDQTYVLQVQRGDTIAGYGSNFRQSYFATKTVWDVEMQDYSAPDPKGVVTRAGTNSAMTTVHADFSASVKKRIHTVGGAMMQGGKITPARYTAKGAGWSGDGPTDSAVSEEGHALPGILASGTLSGSVRTLSGTSAAAPQITRALASQLGARLPPPVTIDRPAAKYADRLSGKIHHEKGRVRGR